LVRYQRDKKWVSFKQQGSKFKSLIGEVIIMAENPLKIIEKLDLELFKNVGTTQTLALGAGALPRKVKLLMAMALDASHGTVEGVKALTLQAMQAGATKEEIMETLRVAQYTSGVGCVYTAAHAYKDLF
jgi:alkylhydroperoxidase/carboxymuconolactone decarboxylase family protein YurZ